MVCRYSISKEQESITLNIYFILKMKTYTAEWTDFEKGESDGKET